MRMISCFVPLALLLCSCGVLQPVEDRSVSHLLDARIPGRASQPSGPAVAIARPALPSYLDRQQLVRRAADGRLEMNAYHLWAEPLDAGISRVTALNLAHLTGSLNIQPVEAFVTMEYQHLLEIRVQRFEPDEQGRVVLEASWKLQPVSGRVVPVRPFRAVIEPSQADDPRGIQSARIDAMNEALARLAREIAAELRRQPQA